MEGLREGLNRASTSILFYICLDLEEPCRGGLREVGLREGYNWASTSILFYICLDLEEPCRGRWG